MHCNFIDVLLLYYGHQQVSVTHVVIFRAVSARIQNVFIVCRNHATAKFMILLVKIPVKW